MGPHPGNLYPFQRHTTGKALWKLVRVVVFLVGALVLGAAGAAQSVAGSSTAQGVAEPSGGAGNRSSPPTEPGGHRPAPGTTSVLVKLNTSFSADEARQLVAANGGSERATIPALQVVVVDIPSGQLQSVRGRYQKDKRVRSVEVDNTRKAAGTPSDPLYSVQWNLPKIGWDQVYGSVTPSGTVILAILDTGVDASHPDLAGKVLPGYSAFAGSDPLTDPNGHGTEMAGITVAATDNQIGVAGVAYSGVSILPVQVLDSTGVGQDSDIVNGVIWATDNGANVILMPFSNGGFSQQLQDAISYAWSKDVVLVAATGNDGSSSATYPAGDTDVVGVAATDDTDSLWSGSNYGADTFIAAPGVGIPTTDVGGGYGTISGTSASAAMVSAVAAFDRAVDPPASNSAIVGRLAQDADPAGTAEQTGNGRVNMQRAVADTTNVSATPTGVPGGGPLIGPYTIAVAAADGQGVMPVSQHGSLTASSTGNALSLQFTNNQTGDMNGALQVAAPAGFSWASISISNSNCQTATLTSSPGPGSGPAIISVTIKCATPKSFTINFTGVSAPSSGLYTFTTSTNVQTAFVAIACSPVVTVGASTSTQANHLCFTTSSFNVTAGTTVSPVTVGLFDVNGNAVNAGAGGLTVNLGTSSSGGIFLSSPGGSPITTITIASGSSTATFQYKDTTAGSPTLSAQALGTDAATQTETITTGAASKLGFKQQPAGATEGSTLTTQPKVAVEDSSGNVITTDNTTLITLTLVASTGSLQGCTAAVRVSSGVATFTGCQVSEEGTADHLHASNGGTFTADSVNFNVADPAVSTNGGFSFSASEGSTSASQTLATFTD